MVALTPEMLVGFATAVAVLGAAMWWNRSRIKTLEMTLFGHERENGGQSKDIEGLHVKIDRVEEKIDQERDSRIQEYKTVRNEVRTNRYLISRNIDKLVEDINRESDNIDINQPDVKPPEEIFEAKWRSEDT